MRAEDGIASEKALLKLDFRLLIEQLVDECSSSLGKALATELKPSAERHWVEKSQQETTEAVFLRRTEPVIPLGGIHDIHPILQQLKLGGLLEGADFLDVLGLLYATRQMKVFLEQKTVESDLPVFSEYATELKVFDVLEKDIGKKIDDDGEVRDRASEKLARIRTRMHHLRQSIRQQTENMLRDEAIQPYLQDQIITIRNNRFVLSVRQEHRQKVPGIIHDQSASGATLYIEPMSTVAKNNDLQQLELDERQEVVRILKELSELMKPYAPDLTKNMAILAKMDLAFGKARLSEKMDGVSPQFLEKPDVFLLRARHPLIDRETVVPIDISLNDETTCMVITGPNTGGKTISLKTVGLLILMHQSGLHIPANAKSSLGFFDGVFADIGDEQSIEQSLSTFSSHLTNICDILKRITPHSLVLFDELGAGTDPSEGAALAMAILETVLASGCRIMATTHYSALKNFAYRTPGVINSSVEFDIDSLRPTYRLLVGVPGNSNAFEIAKRIGLPSHITEQAQALALESESEAEQILKELEATQAENAAMRFQLEAEKRLLEKREEILEREETALLEQSEDILNTARARAANILSEARQEADAVLRDMKQLSKEANLEAAQKAGVLRKQLVDDAWKMRDASNKNKKKTSKKPLQAVRKGDEVYLNEYRQKATVLQGPNKNGELQVQAGIMKINVHISQVSSLESGQKTAIVEPRKSSGRGVRAFSPELDIRGMLVEEARPIVDKYLDDAFLHGLNEVQIIHGKGTGALRTGIRNALKHHPHVAAQRPGDFHEGGDGVTVVTIK